MTTDDSYCTSCGAGRTRTTHATGCPRGRTPEQVRADETIRRFADDRDLTAAAGHLEDVLRRAGAHGRAALLAREGLTTIAALRGQLGLPPVGP